MRSPGGTLYKLLTTYLIVTGIAAFVALAMPGLVVIATFLIIPGLILSLAPTAFLWGCIFAGGWWAARALLGDTPQAIVAGFIFAAAVLFAIPLPSRASGQIAQRLAMKSDVTPPQRIAMTGDIRIDRPRPRWDNANARGAGGLRGFACDNLCLALLFTPGVSSVTVNKLGTSGAGGFDVEARTYRLVPKAVCPETAIRPDLDGATGLYSDSSERARALTAEWNLRLASDVCLVVSPPVARHDLLIRETESRNNGLRGDWSLGFNGPAIESVEVQDGAGKVLLRRFKSSVTVLSRLLYISPYGGIENFRFGWGRSTVTNKTAWNAIQLLPELDAHTDIVGRIQNADLLPELRQGLAKALGNPTQTTDSPAFALIGAYIDALSDPLPAEDLTLLARLAADDRISQYQNIYKLAKLPAEQQTVIWGAFVDRALTTGDSVRLFRSGAPVLASKMTQGSFATLTSDEQRLLGDPARAWSLYTLAGRLDEGGAANVPLILGLIRDHSRVRRDLIDAARLRRNSAFDHHYEVEGHSNVIANARDALCRMGPVGASALAPLEAMIADGTVDTGTGFQGSDWNFTLARLGKPVEQLRKPPDLSGTDESHRRRIRQRLEHFKPDRSC